MNNVTRIGQIFKILSSLNPEPKTELEYTNEFTLLVAIILSAQSTDVGVNRATKALFQIVNTPQDLKNMGIDKLKAYIKTLGLYNNKAKNLMLLADELLDKSIPNNLEALEKLPGVGSKTARVFLNCARKIPVIAVDTHVFRVSKRLGLVSGDSPKSVETELNELVPEEWKLHAHHWLILHGRYVCKARNPDCQQCQIKNLCSFVNKSR